MHRRDWLKQMGVGSMAVLPTTALLADSSLDINKSVLEIVGDANVKPDSRVELLVRADAQNGAVVPVGIHSTVPDTKRIILLVDNHQQTMVAELDTSNALLEPILSTHLQLTNPATISALVEAPTGWHMNTAIVKTLGEDCEE